VKVRSLNFFLNTGPSILIFKLAFREVLEAVVPSVLGCPLPGHFRGDAFKSFLLFSRHSKVQFLCPLEQDMRVVQHLKNSTEEASLSFLLWFFSLVAPLVAFFGESCVPLAPCLG